MLLTPPKNLLTKSTGYRDKARLPSDKVLLPPTSRFEEQLHRYLAEDMEPLGDLLGLPLYLPQSLLSTPAATCPLVKSPMSAAQEVREGGSGAKLKL